MQKPKQELWVTFVALLEPPLSRQVAMVFSNAVQSGVTDIHLLIQSPGGSVADGVFLFNFFRSLPINITAYNCGNVASAATIAYLGAKKHIVSPSATFMVHRSTALPGNGGNSAALNALANSVALDDARLQALYKAHTKLTDKQLQAVATADLFLSADQAIEAGIADELGNFAIAGPLVAI